ncbi:hypothetical protein TNCV_606901 [Trichonephila clavipes]|nr:hypothetical protein TNCV_606901 [Trichonephila clavipes]
MRDANRSHTTFQVKENDIDSPGTCFTGEIVLSKRRIYFRSFGEISVFETVTTAWPPRSSDLNPSDFWLWGYLKAMVYRDPLTFLSDLKESKNFMCVTFPSSCCFQQLNMRFYAFRC